MPLPLWALAMGVQWLFRWTDATPEEEARAREAAEWLGGLAKEGPVVAITHHTFRALLAKALVAGGKAGSRGEGWSASERAK